MKHEEDEAHEDETDELEEEADVRASSRIVDKPGSSGTAPYPYNPSIFKPEYRYVPPPTPPLVLEVRRHWDRPGLRGDI